MSEVHGYEDIFERLACSTIESRYKTNVERKGKRDDSAGDSLP